MEEMNIETLIKKIPDVLEFHLLSELSPSERRVLANVSNTTYNFITNCKLPVGPLFLDEFELQVHVLEWARKEGWQDYFVDAHRKAANKGNIEVLSWLKANTYNRWPDTETSCAAYKRRTN